MTEVECPMDGCDYTGRVESVEAHISGSQSGGHRGEFGADRRAELVDRAEAKLNGGRVPGVEATEPGDVIETEEGDGTSSTGAKEGDGTATSAESKVAPSKALIVASLVFGLSALSGLSSGDGGEVEAADTGDADRPDGGLLDE